MDINYFQLFELQKIFDVNEKYLEEKYNQLIFKYHPDRYVHKSEFEQKEMAIISATINDAYKTLKSPLKRIIYILNLNGIDLTDQEKTSFPPEFLIEQMQLREELEDIDSISDLEIFKNKIIAYNNDLLTQISHLINNKEYIKSQNITYKLMFLDKLLTSINEKKLILI